MMAFSLLKNPCHITILLSVILILSFKQLNGQTPPEEPDSDLELRLVQVVARHAIRAPEYPYPNDPFKDVETYWPNGWGEITELGKEQAYQLGQFFRRRYGLFLNPKFSDKQLYVLSSDYDRTIMSAQLVMAGLYALNESDSTEKPWEKALFHATVPVHSIPASTDKLIQPHQQCPRLKKIFNETLNTHPEVLNHTERNQELIRMLEEKMGFPKTGNFFPLGNSVGSLMIENMYNLSIPNWAKDLLANKTQMDEFFWNFKLASLTSEQRRLGTGPILTELMKNMNNKISGNETRKFFFYSGHDIIMANILNTLDMFEVHMPTFSSCLIFELYYRNTTQEYVLKLQYKYSLLDDLRELKIPNCTSTIDANDTGCRLEAFSKIVSPYIVEDLDNECALKSVVEEYIGITVLDAILIGVIVLVVLIFLGTEFYHCSKKGNRYIP